MQDAFYASGFLYNLKSQQILLLQPQQIEEITSLWSMLGGESKEGEEAPITFQRIVNEVLSVKLEVEDIHPIYDYFHDSLDKMNYVFYAEVKAPLSVDSFKDSNLSWVSFIDAPKLPFSPHTKQDVIVGERVINLKRRLALNLQ